MEIETIDGNHNFRVRFAPFPSGRTVAVRVEAEHLVDVVVLSRQQLTLFDDGEEPRGFAESQNRRHHRFPARVPAGVPWYLVIVNRRVNPVAVAYDVLW